MDVELFFISILDNTSLMLFLPLVDQPLAFFSFERMIISINVGSSNLREAFPCEDWLSFLLQIL